MSTALTVPYPAVDATLPVPVTEAPPTSRLIRQPGPHPYVLGPYADPIAFVTPGETVTIHTADCFGGLLTSEDQVPSQVLGAHLNPVTGPIWIDGAEPGDTLVVHIDAIQPARDWAVSCLLPHCGGLTGTHETPSLAPQLPERVWIYRRTPEGSFAWRDRWEVPWAPFFGTIGTAPALEAISSASPGSHGGNMDAPEVTVGHTLSLPVRVSGACFFVGDAHAAQGQGELAGPALEIEAYGTFTFDLVKGHSIDWPRIETPERLMTVGSARPMEDAARIAYRELVAWLATDFGFEELDAYQLLTQVGGLHVANMVNTAYSLVASCPKRYLTHDHGLPMPWAAWSSALPVT
ncbi:MAG: acetamidase/formamidase family protein [Chloroflexota bacterium]|nr:acetamidase/formamidase family protein [Chloroflexota bacterium]